jgi:PAS domain S-box-containing protein
MGSTPPTGGDQRGGISRIPASLRFIGKVHFAGQEVTTLFETYPLPACIFHEGTLAFLAVNPAALRHYGYTEEEFLQITMKDIRPPAEVADLVRNLGLPSPGFTRAGVWRHSKKDGQWVDDDVAWVSLVVDGEPCRLVVVMDVTERRWAEELLKNINAETERRLEARTMELQASAAEAESFVRAFAQDAQSPLRRILEYADALAAALPDSSQQTKELNQKIAETVGKLDQFAVNFLRLSNLTYQSVNLQQVNLSRMVASVLQGFREKEPERQVQIEIAPNVQAFADPALAEILLTNLLHNAWKFTRPNPNARIEFDAQPVQGEMVCCIRDNGVGFNAGVPEGLFEPFHRFHPEFEGLGLGLSIAKRIIAKHAGRTWAESQSGQGAVFCFSLPLPPA